MLPSDIETDHAYNLLSRRHFLRAMGATGAGLALSLSGRDLAAQAASPLAPGDGVLIVVSLLGGNDGMNTVVPINNGRYFAGRKGVAIPANQTLGIGGGFGLHPNLTYLKSLYDQGHVALVHGVGYPSASLSHFEAMSTWMGAQAASGTVSGWLGRWLDGSSDPVPLRLVNVGFNVPLHLVGRTRAGSSVSPWGIGLGASTTAQDQRLYAGLRQLSAASTELGPWGDAIVKIERDALAVGRDMSPIFAKQVPDGGEMAHGMAIAARLIIANLGVRVVGISQHSYDTHSTQGYQHDALLGELDAGLRALYAELQPGFAARTTVLVVSEFGRTPAANDSGGTDHGTANTTMVIGQPIAGGMYGQSPSWTDLDANGRFKTTVDFRSIYATVLQGVLGADPREILGATYETLPLLSGVLAAGVPAPPPLPAVPGKLLPVTPTRKLDTREGNGAPLAPFAAGVEATVYVLGAGDVPPRDITAVVMNVTVTEPTAPGFVTVWPTGEAKPNASSLNFVAGQTVPNLVMSKVGANGRISMAVSDGSAHLIADVVGYFSRAGGSSLVPLTPIRLRDTRDTGTPVGAGASIDIKVTGGAGVPASGVNAVVLNVTVTEPTNAGYVTVWPSGEPLPKASSLNFTVGETVPNLVITKVGTNGAVSLFNSDGATHLVVDLLGWFDISGRGPSGFATSPRRLMDTRDAGVKIGADSTMQLKVVDVAGVPSGAEAVVLNVTVVDPTETSFLTVYPMGQPLPTTSNLNFTPGSTVPNQVMPPPAKTAKSASTTTPAKPTSSPTSSAGTPNGRDRQRRRAGSV
jgi:uncharacterized protein (DUF1501 family)